MAEVPAQEQSGKKGLENIIERYKHKLDKLIIQFGEVMDTASTEQVQLRQAEIANVQKTLDAFRYTYQREYGEKLKPAEKEKESKKAKDSGNTTDKVQDKMSAKEVPLFQIAGFTICDSSKEVYPTMDHYLNRFEKILNANTIGCKQTWRRWLPLAVPHDLDHWFKHKVFARKDVNWDKACKIIRKRFTAIDQQMLKARETYTMMQLPGESVADYGTRFMNTARAGGLKDNQNLAISFMSSLQESIQDNVQVAWNGKRGTRKPKRVNEILKVANSLTAYKRKRHDEEANSSNKKYWCPYHKKQVRHKPDDCTLAKPKEHKAKSKSESLYDKGLCIYCGKKWDKDHRCEEYRIAKKQKREAKHDKKLNALASHSDQAGKSADTDPVATTTDTKESTDMDQDTHPAEDVGDEVLSDLEDIDMILQSSGTSLGNITKDKRSHVLINSPILIQNKRYWALVDSGAEISVVNKRLCHDNNWSIQSIDGNIVYPGTGDQRARIGITKPLNISYNGHKTTFAFEVMDLDKEDVIIGADLMPHIGLAITGLAVRWDDEEEDSSENEMADSDSPNDAPAGSIDERKAFFDGINKFLEDNANIPSTTFCNIPESVVELPTPEGVTSYHRQYPIPFKLRPVIDAAVEKWLKDGVIVKAPVNTSWNSPLTLADKKDAYGNKTGKRPCLDPRHINRYLPDDRYPLPLIREIFQDLGGSKVFTTLDLTNAFHRFKIKDDDQHKTTFTHNGQQYMFQGCPFGLKPISSKFQRVMHIIFQDMPFVRTFVDDIVIFSSDMKAHLAHVQQAIHALTAANLILNPNKCHFAQTSIYLLGFCISHNGITLDPRKVSNAVQWPVPQNGKDIQRFMGIINYFRSHIPNVSQISAPLEALREKGCLKGLWGNDHTLRFNKLKEALVANVPLKYPNLHEPFYVATDASNYGIGAVLFQRQNNKTQYVGFMARSLSKSERNYSTTKRELLAVIFALDKFHQFLWGNPFTLYTDHKALTYLHTQKIANPMMINWLDTLLNYTFTVVHLPGLKNVLPDRLSRLFTPSAQLEGGKGVHKVKSKHISAIRRRSRKKQIITAASPKLPTDTLTPPTDTDRQSELEDAHLQVGHAGAEHIVRYLQYTKGVHWNTILQDAVEVVKRCPKCQMFNIAKRGYNPLRPIYAYIPGDHWAVDLATFNQTTHSGNNYLLVMVDVCTRFCILRALPNKQSDTLVIAFTQIFCDFGIPKVIQSDNGTEFKNSLMKKLVDSLGIEHRLTTPYHPRANGIAERWVQSSTQIIRKRIEGSGKDWDFYVPSTQLALNMRVSKRLQCPPFSLMFARNVNEFRDYRKEDSTNVKPMSYEQLVERIEHMQKIVFPALKERTMLHINLQKKKFDKKHRLIDFPENSHVMARVQTRGSKLAPVYEGPYTVLRKTQGGSYILQDETGSLMPRDYAPSELKLISQDEVVPTDELYEVQAIINHRGQPNKREYLVRWKGYGPEDDSWLTPDKFTDPDFIMQYWNRLGKKDVQSQSHADNTSSKRKAQSNHTTTRRSKRLRQ